MSSGEGRGRGEVFWFLDVDPARDGEGCDVRLVLAGRGMLRARDCVHEIPFGVAEVGKGLGCGLGR